MIRAPVPGLEEGEVVLAPSVARYVVRVRRVAEGESFVAFDPDCGVEADVRVVKTTGGGVIASVGPVRTARMLAARTVTWLQGLPKGEKMDAIVRDATELGVTRIVPVMTELTVVKLEGPRREAKRQRWERIAREAARQCGRGDAPEIGAVVGFGEAVRQASGDRFCLYERATVPVAPLLLSALETASSFTFAAGPEGGFAPAEVALAQAQGFAVVSLGPLILRTETAAAATLGALTVMSALSSV